MYVYAFKSTGNHDQYLFASQDIEQMYLNTVQRLSEESRSRAVKQLQILQSVAKAYLYTHKVLDFLDVK